MDRTNSIINARMILILAIIGLVSLVGGVSAATLTAGSAQVDNIGDTATVDFILDDASTGLNGYNLTVDLIDDTGIATITGVTYPAWTVALLTSNSTWPTDVGYLKAAGVLASGTNVNIATITVKGVAKGTTKVNVTVSKMSDTSGTNLRSTLALVPGTFTVGKANTAPVAADQSVSTNENTAKEITLGATDADDDTLTYSAVSGPSHGTLGSISAAGVVTYTPTTNYVGTDTFTFKANDGTVDSNIATVTITVTETTVVPIAAFTAVPTYLSVQFTDESTGSPTEWAWDFGDGSTSADQNPTHTYTSDGTYPVKLTVTNGAGSGDVTQSVTVSAEVLIPVVNFVGDIRTGDAPLTVHFTDTSTNTPTAWAWDFQNDGVIDSTEQNPDYVYTAPGTYPVNLTASNAAGSAFRLKGNYIVVSGEDPNLPGTDFTSDVRSGYVPLTVHFTDTSTNTPTEWAWDFQNDGIIDSREQNPSFTYTSTGTFQVRLNATNAVGTKSRLKANYITVNPVNPETPVAAFTAVPTYLSVQFTDESTGSPTEWAWDFNDDGTTDSTETNPVHTYAAAGTYTVTLKVTNSAGSDTASHDVTVTAPSDELNAAFTADVTSGESPLKITFNDESTGSPTKWYWTFGDGTTSMQQNPVHTYTGKNGRSYTVTLTVINANGKDTEVKTNYITIAAGVKPEAAFTADVTTGESPLKVTFTDESTGSPTRWYWTFGDGATSTDQNPVHTYMSTREKSYTVTLTVANANGRDTETKTKYITVSPADQPDAAFTADVTSGESPLKVTFADESTGSPTRWYWTFGDGATSTDQNPVHTYMSTREKSYTVTLTVANANGRDTETKTKYITVSPADQPEAAFTADVTTGESPLKVTFTDESTGSPTRWYWTFGDGATSTDQNPVHTYMSTREKSYTVTLTVANANGRDTETKTKYITVSPADQPDAAFTADVTSGESPLKVTFADESTGSPTRWYWTFGDGATSTDQNPVHTYMSTREKSYTVTLTVANANGRDTETKTKYITVSPADQPEAAFTADVTTGESPLKVTFTDESTGSPTRWYWTFGDGATSTDQNPVHTYMSTREKSYTVTLTVANANGRDTETKTKYITVSPADQPDAAFTADVTSGESPLKVTFADESTGSPTRWYWTFGDGSTSTKQNPTHTYTSRKNGQTYTVSLTVVNTGGRDTETKTKYITIKTK